MYGKIWGSMFDGSLVETRWEAVVTFMVLITLADKNGIVDMTPTALAGRTTIPKEIFEAGLKVLESPDNASRTDSDDGRRIIRLDEHREWGWTIVNYEKYANAKNMDALRAHWKEQKRGYRERKKERDVADEPFTK